METAHIESVLDHSKNTDFMDTATYFDTPLSGLDYLQYPPHSPFGVSMGCKNPLSFSHAFTPINLFFPVPPTSSPRSFSSLPLSGGLNEYTYTSPSGNYSTGSPARPYTPTIYPNALSNSARVICPPTVLVPTVTVAAAVLTLQAPLPARQHQRKRSPRAPTSSRATMTMTSTWLPRHAS